MLSSGQCIGVRGFLAGGHMHNISSNSRWQPAGQEIGRGRGEIAS